MSSHQNSAFHGESAFELAQPPSGAAIRPESARLAHKRGRALGFPTRPTRYGVITTTIAATAS